MSRLERSHLESVSVGYAVDFEGLYQKACVHTVERHCDRSSIKRSNQSLFLMLLDSLVTASSN